MKLRDEKDFREIYDGASLVVPDGMPLVWASKFLGDPLKEKVSGSDLVPRLCKLSAMKGYRMFFLGGRYGAAYEAMLVKKREHPLLNVVGAYCPPFGFENDSVENAKIVKMIQEAKPHILCVGLGAPKQEKWIYRHYKELNVPVSIGVGGTFEFISGMVDRAPSWMQNSGMEWAWRLAKEPGRLWKRYLIDDMKFFSMVLKQKLNKRT